MIHGMIFCKIFGTLSTLIAFHKLVITSSSNLCFGRFIVLKFSSMPDVMEVVSSENFICVDAYEVIC